MVDFAALLDRTPITRFRGNYQFLSNFYPVWIEYKGVMFPSVEHAYQAAKSFAVADRLKISNALTPADAKKIGKRLSLRPDWEEVKLGIMFDLLLSKFSGELRVPLIDTGNRPLVEGNVWGDSILGSVRRRGRKSSRETADAGARYVQVKKCAYIVLHLRRLQPDIDHEPARVLHRMRIVRHHVDQTDQVCAVGLPIDG